MNRNRMVIWLTGLIGAFLVGCVLMGHLWAGSSRNRAFGVVDAAALVAFEAQKIAKLYPKGVVPPEKLQTIATGLKKRVDDFARQHKMIIFAKGAVWGGVLWDHTEFFLEEELRVGENPDAP